MHVDFVGQPFQGKQSIGDVLIRWLGQYDCFWAMVAWSQVGGLMRLREALETFTRAGGSSRVIVGIDQGIASPEGLELTSTMFGEAFVFYDPSGRTFHPKVFWATKGPLCHVLVGSGNLTEGGLANNYEAGVEISLDLDQQPDREFYDDILAFWAGLRADDMPCRPLNQELIAKLALLPGILVTERQRAKAARRPPEPLRNQITAIFPPPSTHELTSRRTVAPRPRPTEAILVPRQHGSSRGGAVPTSGRSMPSPLPKLAWTKRLTASDAIHKPGESHQRNYVVLGSAGHPIDRETWFRNELFGLARWKTVSMKSSGGGGKKRKEQAIVAVSVFVDSRALGKKAIRVDHTMGRESSQNNAPTWLNWNDLTPMIKQRDFTGWLLTLRREADGEIQLHIDRPPARD